MKILSALLAASLLLACRSQAEIKESRLGSETTWRVAFRTNLGETYVCFDLNARFEPGGVPRYFAALYISTPEKFALDRSASLLIYARSNSLTLSDPESTATKTQWGDSSQMQWFDLTPLQMRDLTREQTTTLHIRGTRKIELIIDWGTELQEFFRRATNAIYAAARIERPTAPKPDYLKFPNPQLGQVAWKVIEQNNTWWKFSYQMPLKNAGDGYFNRGITFRFLDAQGFEVDSRTEYDLHLKPGESMSVVGTIMIKSANAPTVKRATAELAR